MRITIKISFILIIALSCDSKSQKIEMVNPNKEIKMDTIKPMLKKFDIKDYEQKKIADNSYEGYTRKDGVEITEISITNDQIEPEIFTRKNVEKYIQTEKGIDGFSDIFVFDKDGVLTEYSRYFQDLETGIWKTYATDGKITSEDDKDKHYSFSIQQVINFSKKT